MQSLRGWWWWAARDALALSHRIDWMDEAARSGRRRAAVAGQTSRLRAVHLGIHRAKGVMHGNLAAALAAWRSAYGAGQRTHLQIASAAFDNLHLRALAARGCC
jgi:hypothetical protein